MEVTTLKNFQNNTGELENLVLSLKLIFIYAIVLMMKSPKQSEGNKRCDNCSKTNVFVKVSQKSLIDLTQKLQSCGRELLQKEGKLLLIEDAFNETIKENEELKKKLQEMEDKYNKLKASKDIKNSKTDNKENLHTNLIKNNKQKQLLRKSRSKMLIMKKDQLGTSANSSECKRQSSSDTPQKDNKKSDQYDSLDTSLLLSKCRCLTSSNSQFIAENNKPDPEENDQSENSSDEKYK